MFFLQLCRPLLLLKFLDFPEEVDLEADSGSQVIGVSEAMIQECSERIAAYAFGGISDGFVFWHHLRISRINLTCLGSRAALYTKVGVLLLVCVCSPVLELALPQAGKRCQRLAATGNDLDYRLDAKAKGTPQNPEARSTPRTLETYLQPHDSTIVLTGTWDKSDPNSTCTTCGSILAWQPPEWASAFVVHYLFVRSDI